MNRLKGDEGVSYMILLEESSRQKGTASAKAPALKAGWCVQEAARRSVWLEQNEEH